MRLEMDVSHRMMVWMVCVVSLSVLAMSRGAMASQTVSTLSPSVTSMDNGGVNQCTYTVPSPGPGCTISQTEWQLCACPVTVFPCPSGYDLQCFTTPSAYQQYSYGDSWDIVTKTPTSYVIKTASSDWAGYAEDCPEKAKAWSNYACEPVCEKKTWYCDWDGDGVGSDIFNYNADEESCDKPPPHGNCAGVGGTFVDKIGDVCPLNPELIYEEVEEAFLCWDYDEDGYPSDMDLACHNKANPPQIIPCDGSADGKSAGGYGSEAFYAILDCDDKDPSAGPAQSYAIDKDGDHWYRSVLPGLHCEPPQDDNAIPKSLTLGKESAPCDTNPDAHIMGSWSLDQDGDGYAQKTHTSLCADTKPDGYAATPDKDECKILVPYEPTNQWYLDCKKECQFKEDAEKDINPATKKWYLDCDGDGYYNAAVGTGCKQPESICPTDDSASPTATREDATGDRSRGRTRMFGARKETTVARTLTKSPMQKLPTGGAPSNPTQPTSLSATTAAAVQTSVIKEYTLKHTYPGSTLIDEDCDDTDAQKNAGTIWGVDADEDGWFDLASRKKQCTGVNVDCDDAEDPNCGSYVILTDEQEEACDWDDGDTEVGNSKYFFSDKDGDGLGDPVIAKALLCESEGKNPETIFADAGEAADDNAGDGATVNDDDKWAEAPNDLFPTLQGQNAGVLSEAILQGQEYAFLVQETLPPHCLSKDDTELPFCRPVPGIFCSGNFSKNSKQSISCLAEDFLTQYCPAVHSAYWPYGTPGGFAAAVREKFKKEILASGITPEELSTRVPPWDLAKAFPFTTSVAIITPEEFSELSLQVPPVFDDPVMISNCMIGAATGFRTIGLKWKLSAFINGKDQVFSYLPVRLPPETEDLTSGFATQHVLMSNYLVDDDVYLDYGKYPLENPGLSTYSIPAPVTKLLSPMAELKTYFGKFQIIDRLDGEGQLKSLSRWIDVRFPFEKSTASVTTSSYCLYKGVVAPTCAEADVELSNTSDTDQDGVRDVVEMRAFPWLEVSAKEQMTVSPSQIALSPFLTPKLLSNWAIVLHRGQATKSNAGLTNMFVVHGESLSAEEYFFWQAGKARAKELLESVYNRTQEIAANLPAVIANLTPEEWNALIDIAVPMHVADFDGPFAAAFLNVPIHPRRPLYGLNSIQDATLMSALSQSTGETGLQLSDSQKIIVDIWQIISDEKSFDTLGNQNQAIVNSIADTILHEVLHSHIEIPNDQMDFEHVLIYAIMGEYHDFGCGTQK